MAVILSVALNVHQIRLYRQRRLAHRASRVRIPEDLREIIGQRLNRSSERCKLVLTTAPVNGRECSLGLLDRLLQDISEDQLLEAVEEASEARVIEELPQMVGQYQFAHMLTQETLSEELSLTRRVRLHAQIGETLEGPIESTDSS